MADQEEQIEKWETLFPSVSGPAFAAARQKVLDSGQSVLQSENGFIYEVFPNGARKCVKKIEPPTTVVPGRKITLR